MEKRIYITQKQILNFVKNGIDELTLKSNPNYMKKLFNDLLTYYTFTEVFEVNDVLKNNINILLNYFISIEDYKKCQTLRWIQTNTIEDIFNSN